jgi:hypothetical protein
MLIKINRQDCLKKYPAFPLRDYDYAKDEEEFFYPTIFKSYILTLSSKSFRGHVKQLGIELVKLIEELDCNTLIFLGDTKQPWLHQDNDYKPAREAKEYLTENKIGKRFNGALQIDNSEIITFIKHLSWLTRCNASLPYFYFTNDEQQFIGNICKYGNLHIDTLNITTDRLFKRAINKGDFKYLDSKHCYNQFGTSL